MFVRKFQSQNGLSWKGLLKVISSKPLLVGRVAFHQHRLFKAPSCLTLGMASSRVRASPFSLDSLVQCPTSLLAKKILTCVASFSLKSSSFFLSLQAWKEAFLYWKTGVGLPQNLIFPWLDNHSSLSLSSWEIWLSPLIISVALSGHALTNSCIFFCKRITELCGAV